MMSGCAGRQGESQSSATASASLAYNSFTEKSNSPGRRSLNRHVELSQWWPVEGFTKGVNSEGHYWKEIPPPHPKKNPAQTIFPKPVVKHFKETHRRKNNRWNITILTYRARPMKCITKKTHDLPACSAHSTTQSGKYKG